MNISQQMKILAETNKSKLIIEQYEEVLEDIKMMAENGKCMLKYNLAIKELYPEVIENLEAEGFKIKSGFITWGDTND